MSKIKNGGLDQNGAEPFEQQQFGTAGVEGFNAKGHYQMFIFWSSAQYYWCSIADILMSQKFEDG